MRLALTQLVSADEAHRHVTHLPHPPPKLVQARLRGMSVYEHINRVRDQLERRRVPKQGTIIRWGIPAQRHHRITNRIYAIMSAGGQEFQSPGQKGRGMTRTDKDRAFRIQKPPGYFPPQAWHRLRHATPRRNDACIAKACFFAGRLAVDHRDGQSAFSQLQGTADADYAGTDHNHLIAICPSACSHHPCKPVSNGLCSCPLPTTGGPLTCLGRSAQPAQARG